MQQLINVRHTFLCKLIGELDKGHAARLVDFRVPTLSADLALQS